MEYRCSYHTSTSPKLLWRGNTVAIKMCLYVSCACCQWRHTHRGHKGTCPLRLESCIRSDTHGSLKGWAAKKSVGRWNENVLSTRGSACVSRTITLWVGNIWNQDNTLSKNPRAFCVSLYWEFHSVSGENDLKLPAMHALRVCGAGNCPLLYGVKII